MRRKETQRVLEDSVKCHPRPQIYDLALFVYLPDSEYCELPDKTFLRLLRADPHTSRKAEN
jgi:hypothetical protein